MDNEEITGVKFSEFPSATPDNADEVVGLHSGDNARFSVANFILAIRQGMANLFVPKTYVGAANGVASLDSNGKVPGTQLDLSGKQSTITASGILKGDGAGGVSPATPGTDYAPADHASSATTYGKGDASNYGHLRLSNSTNLNSGVVDGIAATPKAVKDTYDYAATKADENSYTGTFASSSTTYVSSASVSDCKRSGMLVGLALSLSLAAQIPISRQTFGQLHGVPTPKVGAVGVMQIVNALFAVAFTASGELQIEAIGAAGGGSGWSGQVTIMYITDGTILA